jgi:hypothetical protein
MRRLFALFALVAFAASCSRIALALGPFPQLLPPASEFELTLREDLDSKLPLGPSCGGEAGLTLACRAFVVTLKNIGEHTVHLSRIDCQEPVVNFEMKEPKSSNGWWPISLVARPRCTPWTYVNLRLKPGESTEYTTRLISPNRKPGYDVPVAPRSYMIRAQWIIQGCTENPEGSDCLAPLQVMKTASLRGQGQGDVEFQTPVKVVSDEIEANSPVLPNLGTLKIAFEVIPNPQAWTKSLPMPAKCDGQAVSSIECIVFHYAIRNLGDRAIRNGRYSCSDYSVNPEYRTGSGEWKQLDSRPVACSRNIYFETPILPGETAEGDFILSGPASEFDTTPLYPAGDYQLRFRFQASACFASSDGSFCLQRPKDQPAVLSNEVVVHATEFVPSGTPQQE